MGVNYEGQGDKCSRMCSGDANANYFEISRIRVLALRCSKELAKPITPTANSLLSKSNFNVHQVTNSGGNSTFF